MRNRGIEAEIGDIYGQLNGLVSPGLINRVIQCGGMIPESGPGKRSIPKALARTRDIVVLPQKSKEQRRSWNLNHQAQH